jgi:phosphoglucosamine mutase
MALGFGTDGVRGQADEFTDAFVIALGEAAARVLGSSFVLGRDTRASGERIERALVIGLSRGGAAVASLGVAPTPAVAWVAARHSICGAVISASHNQWSDNGIKFFGPGGRKLSDAVEAELEAALADVLAAADGAEVVGAEVVGADPDSTPSLTDGETSSELVIDPNVELGAWAEALRSSVTDSMRGLRVVIDCANGAQSILAPEVLSALGVELEVLHAAPDGRNINDGCGSTHPQDLQRRVVESGAQVGIAFDGDADRLLAVDETGAVVDGDHLLALFADDLRSSGSLRGNQVVVTVMTNLGFRLAMAERGIEVIETPVGDRYVLEALARTNGSLGGEQSGHIVFADLSTTGDGLLSGLQLLDLLARSGRPLSELAAASMTQLPQVLRNVKVATRRSDIAVVLEEEIRGEQEQLGALGRILLRPSGTEPLIRVMVEAESVAVAEAVAERLAAAVERACSA